MEAISEPVLFNALLRPHRSLEVARFRLLMLAIAMVSFGAGLAFYAIGAWPVIGFLGVDVLLIYWAFKINYRAARCHEQVRLTAGNLSIERVDIYGARTTADLPPYWIRVELEERQDAASRLRLWTHGKATALGDFLSSDERARLARDLQSALERLRA
ncbi:DUF2244 domain-containing protein [Lacibacterium aquatile]|uniref:DUF2244 domain-containing protein n=1 Tax=Lacibacterium aquatile TaxID=1168082 RepID=A0ABW5DMV3_9PROT